MTAYRGRVKLAVPDTGEGYRLRAEATSGNLIAPEPVSIEKTGNTSVATVTAGDARNRISIKGIDALVVLKIQGK